MERRREVIISHAILVVGAILALYPFVSILSLALSEPGTRPTGFTIPDGLHLGNFEAAWTRGLFSQALLSSLIVTVTVVVAAVLCSVLAGYAFGVLRFPMRGALMGLLLVGLVMPYEATIISIYHQMRDLGLLNTYLAVILPQIGFSVALGTFWMRTAFAGTPASLREAASIDGASHFQSLARILLPVVAPAIATIATLLFLYTWNEFLLALVMLADNPDVQTAPLSLSFFAGNRRNSDPAVTAAAAVLVALPVLIAYLVFQRRFISGVLAGAVKE